MPDQNNYPRITLKCNCENEFNVNVIRMQDKQPVLCQICGEEFSVEIGEKFVTHPKVCAKFFKSCEGISF